MTTPGRPSQFDLFGQIEWSMGAVERWAVQQGYATIIGVDEAGRGPLAGPVVAAAVVLDLERARSEGWLSEITDSKQLTARQREGLFDRIRTSARARAVAQTEARQIDATNILQATFCAMRSVVQAVLDDHPPQPVIVIVDGKLPLPGVANQRAVVKGDRRSYHVAAASILAKVTRDRIMERCAAVWPQYGFEKHKGYPTRLHRLRIIEYGYCPIHRRSFRLSPPGSEPSPT